MQQRPPLNPELAALRRLLDDTMLADRRALLHALERLNARAESAPDALADWQRRAETARKRYASRAASVPALRVDETLPIAAKSDEIVQLIRAHQVIVLAGETGSGKSTQLPKLCLAAGRGVAGLIGCTQPRRVAARSVARRVATELGGELGGLVGYQVRFAEKTGDGTLIKFMTDGILLAETQSDAWLNAYDTIIIDEAHERSLNIDFLLGYLKRLLARRSDLKLIVTSATIDTKIFSEHFHAAPVVNVEGRGYPVEVRWRPLEAYEAADGGAVSATSRGKLPATRKASSRGEAPLASRGSSDLDHLVAALDEISGEDPRGDVLVFLPGEREIRDAHLALERRRYRATEILPLYARLSAAEQDRVFKPGPARRIVLATNVAETSLTVPRIRYVVDTGTARIKRYMQRSQLERLHIEPIAQSAADQRKGRCGRVGAGICIRLYSEEDFAARPRFSEPEILRASLAGVILRMLSLKLGDVEKFPFVEAPGARAIGDGYRRLIELGAVSVRSSVIAQDQEAAIHGRTSVFLRSSVIAEDQKAVVHGRTFHELTQIGQLMAKLPIDVALARMLVEAQRIGVMRELLILVSFLSIQDPRERPADARQAADLAHAAFADPKSDFVSVLNLWHAHAQAHEDMTQSKLRDWCRERFLSYLRMREWRELHRQLLVIADEMGWKLSADARAAEQALAKTPASKSFARPSLAPQSPSPPSRAMGERAGVRGRRLSVEGSLPGGHPSRHPASSSAVARDAIQGIASAQRLRPHPTLSPNDEAVGGEGFKMSAARGDGPEYEAIHRCLLSGWPTQVGHKDERNQYRGTRERKFQIFPGSVLAKHPLQWLLTAQIIDLQKVYAMLCARIEPEWIEQQAAHLVKRSWREPHWSRKRGAVLAFEQVTLFGLTLVEKRTVQFGAQDGSDQSRASAHAVFVREALVRGDIDSRADCLRANARVLAQAHELEAKQRRAGLLRDEDELVALLAGKLPGDIHTTAAFDAWYRKATPAQQAALHWSLDDVLAGEPGIRASDFPATLEFAAHKLTLEYRFVPGDAADGVTLHVPLAFVNAVSAARCEWLVPGLLADKVAELIRGLPKALRRNFVPAPDFARAFAQAETPRDQALGAALAGYLARVTGVEVSARDFDAVELPLHLRMRFRVYDDRVDRQAGRDLAEGRDLEAIRTQWSDSARAAFSRRAASEITREQVDEFDFDDIPRTLVSEGGLTAFPALVDLGESVALRVFEHADEARAAHARGVERLLRRALREPVKQARRQLPIERKLALKYAAVASVDSLREDIVEAALAELFATRDLDLRERGVFGHAEVELSRALFPRAVEWLALVEDILAAYAELTPWLEPPLMGYARANYDDLHEQLDALVYPGFVRAMDKAHLSHFPRYLKAMRLRAERLRQDATRDQARMLTVRGYWSEYLKMKAQRGGEDAALGELRWLIEELRVSLFAQELKTAEPVSPKRLAKIVEELKRV